VSLDGYLEDERGAIDMGPLDDDLYASYTDLLRSVGTFLYGRRLYEAMAVWETNAALAAQSDLMADFATAWKQRTKSSTRRPWPRCKPQEPGSNTASTPRRHAT
jgi:hypothetical protein